MRYRLNVLWFLLFVSAGVLGSDEVSQSVEMTFTVNIEPPVCKLKKADLLVNFGDFQMFDIVTDNVKQTAEFTFTDCTNVNNVKISFFGDDVDMDKNIIKNKSGPNYASGVAIGLYDDAGKRIHLTEGKGVSIDNVANSFNFRVAAAVLKDSRNAVVTPGKINASVNLNITYN